MRASLWLGRLGPWLWLFLTAGEPPNSMLYPGMRTREALLRGSLPPFNTAEEASSRTCALAERPIPENLPIPLFEDDRRVIQEYKDNWLKLCRKQAEASLAETLRFARQIEIMLHNPLFVDDLPEEKDDQGSSRRERIYQRLDALDQFIPAFYGHVESGEFYSYNRSVFYLFALEAAPEDRQFFQLHFRFARQYNRFPWQGKELCTRFGEYDWIADQMLLDQAKSWLKTPVYWQMISEWRLALWSEFLGRETNFCLCNGGREDLVLDAEAFASYLAQQPSFAPQAKAAGELVEALHKGQKNVRNYAEEGCSYP